MQETVILALHKIILPLLLLTNMMACTELSEFDKKQVQQALADSLLNSTESWDFSMNILEKGVLRLTIKGSYSYNINKDGENTTEISGPVFIDIFNEQGQLDSNVQCDSAVYKPDRKIFEMFGNVRVFTHDGKELRSQHLLWQRTLDKVSTPEFVTFISPPDSITAMGFFGNTDLTEYTLNQASGQVIID